MTDRWRCKSIPTNCLTSYSSIGASYDSWNVNTPASAGNVTRSGGPAPSSHQVGDWCGRRGRSRSRYATGGTIVREVSYKGHRYPAEIIAHCMWLYHRLPLSFREVEELMLVRGVIVSYETTTCGHL